MVLDRYGRDEWTYRTNYIVPTLYDDHRDVTTVAGA